MADARQKAKDLENQANVIVLKIADLQNQFYREDDGFKREGIQREIQKSFYEQDKNKEELAKARDALQDLEKEARKSGALPGWIMEK
jgi:predicted  nucleic acid-binding Zn-ribbon protein